MDRRGFTWEDAAAEHAALVTGWWCGSCAASGPKEYVLMTTYAVTLT
jgi:hypothetical protein